MKIIRVGDFIEHENRGRILSGQVQSIEICDSGKKYGQSVNKISREEAHSAVLTLDNGHWAHGDQIVSGWTEVRS